MRRTFCLLILVVAWSVSCPRQSVADEPSLVGVQIYPKSNDVPIQVSGKVIGQARDCLYPLYVRRVQGEWLWVRVAFKKKEGWIRRSDVCTAQEALEYFDQRIKEDPSSSRAYFVRAIAWAEMGDYDRAIDDMTQHIRLVPRGATGYAARGLLWEHKGEFRIAIQDHNEAIRQEPQIAHQYNNRGNSYLDLGEFDKALADYNEAIRLDPKYANAFTNRSIVYRKTERFEKAIADCNEALQIDPQFEYAFRRRGQVRLELKDFPRALSDFNEAIRINPKMPEGFCGRATTYRHQGAFDKALTDYNEAIHLDPKKPEPFRERAWLWATCSDTKFRDGRRAIESATKAKELDKSDDWSNYDVLAAAFAESGDFAQAVEWQQKALTKAPAWTPAKKLTEARARLELYRSGKPFREEVQK